MTIAVGAVVVKSCEEEYAVLAGVPAEIAKYNIPAAKFNLKDRVV